MRTRVLLSMAAVTISAILPTAVSAAGGLPAAFPGASVLIDIVLPEDGHAGEVIPEVAGNVVSIEPEAEPAEQDLAAVTVTYRIGVAIPEVDLSSLGGPCPNAATCDVFALRKYRWPVDDSGAVHIDFRYNDEGRRKLRAPSKPTVVDALRAAAQEWSNWNSNLVLSHVGATEAGFAELGSDGGCADGVNGVGWERFDNDVVGVASVCLDRNTDTIREADLALNINHQWQQVGVEDERRSAFDVQSIYTHEFGHWFSLVDLYTSWNDNRQTMFGSAEPDTTHLRTLALGDVVGVQTAYPCGDGDSCPRDGIIDD